MPNLTVCAHTALELADEYGIKLWIAALLDPEPITHGTSDPKKSIKSPPPYHMKEMANGSGRSPEKPTPAKGTAGRRSARGTRSMRSESPTMEKSKTPRKIATPRKRGKRAATLEPVEEDGKAVNGAKGDTVKVQIENTTVPGEDGDEEVESTKVNITMPSDHPDMPIPKQPTKVVEKAGEAVKEAVKIDNKRGKKRGRGEVDDDDEEVESSTSPRPAKRPRPAETELRKEKIRRRALAGIAASLAIGSVISSLTS